jgi:hypothetical protein
VDSKTAPKTIELAQAAVDHSNFARDWRNRRLSHYDLQVAQARSDEPLALASREHVRQAIPALDEAINYIDPQYIGHTTIFGLADLRGNA